MKNFTKLLAAILALMLLTACAPAVPAETTTAPTEATTAPTTAPTTEPTSALDTVPAPPLSTESTAPPTEPETPEKAPLSQVNIDFFKKFFQQEAIDGKTSPINYYNRILWSDFEFPEDIEVWLLFYDQDPDEDQALTAAEKTFLDPPDERVVTRVSAAKIDSVLEQCLGLTLEQTNQSGLEYMHYLADTDCYYTIKDSFGGDTACQFNISAGWSLGNGIIQLEYEILDSDDWQKVITLKKTNEGYHVLSNITAPRKLTSPKLEKQNMHGSYSSDEICGFIRGKYQGSSPTDRKNPLARCALRYELQEGSLYEYCKSLDRIQLIADGPIHAFCQTREYYYYILETDLTTIWQQDRTGSAPIVFFTSQQGNITDLAGYYGYEDDGELVFVTDNTFIHLCRMPEQKFILIYEGCNNIDAIVSYSREKHIVEFRDKQWSIWDYSLDSKELSGPF